LAVLRDVVRERLRRGEFEEVLDLLGREHRLVRTVVSLLYEGEELVRWRAVTAIGLIARAEPEKVRPLVRRFLWWMNDEAGGIGWSSAPALGEIGRQSPDLLRDAVRVVVFWRQERILLDGVLWAVGRLAATYPGVTREAVPDLIAYLGDGDGRIRGLAAWSLVRIGDRRAAEALGRLEDDREIVRIYEKRDLVDREIRSIAREAEAMLGSSG